LTGAEDYARLLKAIRAAEASASRKHVAHPAPGVFAALSAIDFFPGEAMRQTEEALKAREAAASGEPGST
jgi:hypothetical protein